MEKNMDKKNIIIFLIIILVCIISIVIFLFWKHSRSDKSLIKKNVTVKSISAKYDNISYGKSVSLKDNVITESGSYDLTGNYNCITINTSSNVQLNLKNANIECSNGPAIYIVDANNTNIHISGTNSIEATTTEALGGAIYSKDDLILSGEGTLNVTSNYDGIASSDDLIFKSGTYNIDAEDEGIRGKDNVAIANGNYTINSNGNGIKATNEKKALLGTVVIDNGNYTINSQKDAIEAVNDLIINDGEFKIQTTGNANKSSLKGLKAGKLIQIGKGNFDITTNDDGIHSSGDIGIIDGNIKIKSNDEAIQATGILQIDNGEQVLETRDGLSATYIKINGGNLTITASGKGLKTSNKSSKYKSNIEINNGTVDVKVGRGTTVALDSRDDITMNGGTLKISAQTAFNFGGKATYNGGKITVNGKETTKIEMNDTTSRENKEENNASEKENSGRKASRDSSHEKASSENG